MPVADHQAMLSKQFLASASRSEHPSHEVIRRPSGRRRMKASIQDKFKSDVRHLLTDDVLPSANYGLALKDLHTSSVASSMDGLAAN